MTHPPDLVSRARLMQMEYACVSGALEMPTPQGNEQLAEDARFASLPRVLPPAARYR